MQEFEGISVKKIDNIPYVLGAEAIREAFEKFGIKKSKKAVYKFLSKTSWKRRVKENGRSVIAVPIYEIKRWIEKNYPMVSQGDEEEKKYISKNFGIIDGFQKIINDISAKIEDTESVPEIFNTMKEEKEKKTAKTVSDTDEPNERILKLSNEFISLLINNPPSKYEKTTLEKIKEKIIFIYAYIENISKLKELE
ncbi:MAG: serine/arginine-rich splicing factor [Candidatus Calescibacterium sp.]|nr:serine/arginine-rich splicing factor [Candidatus Calescibacterium sp.]MCX7734533.1 serine/arginine-rich splicing factor [bacterium]MDW8087643.1 hypothetical protein [Candidatus Calescibacterium sp.]